MKTEPHNDAAALDRMGFQRVQDHFNISRQAFAYWKKNGVPNLHRKTLMMLAGQAGIQVPELVQNKDRRK